MDTRGVGDVESSAPRLFSSRDPPRRNRVLGGVRGTNGRQRQRERQREQLITAEARSTPRVRREADTTRGACPAPMVLCVLGDSAVETQFAYPADPPPAPGIARLPGATLSGVAPCRVAIVSRGQSCASRPGVPSCVGPTPREQGIAAPMRTMPRCVSRCPAWAWANLHSSAARSPRVSISPSTLSDHVSVDRPGGGNGPLDSAAAAPQGAHGRSPARTDSLAAIDARTAIGGSSTSSCRFRLRA